MDGCWRVGEREERGGMNTQTSIDTYKVACLRSVNDHVREEVGKVGR
jgi:hypothetical protein